MDPSYPFQQLALDIFLLHPRCPDSRALARRQVSRAWSDGASRRMRNLATVAHQDTLLLAELFSVRCNDLMLGIEQDVGSPTPSNKDTNSGSFVTQALLEMHQFMPYVSLYAIYGSQSGSPCDA